MKVFSRPTPTVFTSLNLRNGRKFRSLKRQKITSEDAFYVCLMYHSVALVGTEPDVDSFCQQYDLSEGTVRRWLGLYKKFKREPDFAMHYTV